MRDFSDQKLLNDYYDKLKQLQNLGITHEQGTRIAFQTLLDALGKQAGWNFVPEEKLTNRKRPDGTFYDNFKLPRGYWEAKDTADDLDNEIQNKIRRDYPLSNTIFEDTQRAVLFQHGRKARQISLR